ncbi:3'-5' exonuclease [Bradyrhizobium sp. USDA 3262]
MPSDEIDLATMAEILMRSSDYRVLRRLAARTEFTPSEGQATKTGILLDVETTGLNTAQDEIIELAMVKFDYLPDDSIARITDVFSSFNEPQNPIPAEITELTGIADEMVVGHRIEPEAVSAFVSDAVIIVAHNANFDRKFVERYWPVFERKPWACSATEIEWRKHGFDGSRLGYLLAGVGLFHQAHRAIDDCRALVEILSFNMPNLNRSAFAVLLERARRKTIRIWAEQSPFELKDALKKRGYRWSDGSDGRPRSWYVDVDEAHQDAEIAFLRKTIYLRDADPRQQILSAMNRFSIRV